MNLAYRLSRLPFRLRIPHLVGSLTIEGLENLPARGPFLLLPNHQSALDAPLLQSYCPRGMHTMTKSTQFIHPFYRWILPRIGAFPVRRYRVDPLAVRQALRILKEGYPVCIYPEGERTWDGRLQPLRRGALKLMLAVDVPVIPCGLQGLFDLWPRWSRWPHRGVHVTIRFGRPLELGPFPDRASRHAFLPQAERMLREALLELSGEEPAVSAPSASS
jgi:1-acyl-sn-glycerol-3-phosphate acyltransferase